MFLTLNLNHIIIWLKNSMLVCFAISFMIIGGERCNAFIDGVYRNHYSPIYFQIEGDRLTVFQYEGYGNYAESTCKFYKDGDFITFTSLSIPMQDIFSSISLDSYDKNSHNKTCDIEVVFSSPDIPECIVNLQAYSGSATYYRNLKWTSANTIKTHIPYDAEYLTFSITPTSYDKLFANGQYFGLLSAKYPMSIDCANKERIEIRFPYFNLYYFDSLYFYEEKCLIKDNILYWNGMKYHKTKKQPLR